MSTAQSRLMSRRHGLHFVAVVCAAAAFGGCLGGSGRDEVAHTGAETERPVTSGRSGQEASELRLVRLQPLNGSGVRGVARLRLDGRRLGVDSIASGAAPTRAHMQHIHLPDGGAEGKCPTRSLDADGDGLVSLDESVSSYGAPAVSLEPFPMSEEPDWEYEQVLTVPKSFALDRGVIVLHGLPVRGRYDELIACGVIDDDAVTREVALEPVNHSVIAGTARVALSGSDMYVWLSLGGYITGRQHMQHIHVPEGRARGNCPTRELDTDHDGLISLEEGTPAYGAPAVSLEPFPAPTNSTFEYSHTLNVPAGFELDGAVIVVHGMDTAGRNDKTIPVACGAIDPNAAPVSTSTSGALSGSAGSSYRTP